MPTSSESRCSRSTTCTSSSPWTGGSAGADLLLTFDGLAVGFLGLTTPETAWVSSPGPDVVFVDPRVTGREAASRLRARGAKLVVAITHQGMAADRALAGAAGLDVILGGHEHEPLIAEDGKTLITKAGSDARYLVQVDLWVARDGRLVERSWKFREVSRRALRQAFEHGLAQADRQGGGFLQVSGVRLVWDPQRPAGARIVSAHLGGRPLAADAVYTVAVLDYLYRGGDGFVEFARAKVLVSRESGPQLGDLILDAIAKRGTIAPAVDDRRSEEHTSELQSRPHLVCRLLLENKK